MNKRTIVSRFLSAQDAGHCSQTIADLSLKDVLYLTVLMRSSTFIGNEGHVGPITKVPPLTPTYAGDGGLTCISYLIDRYLISVSPKTDVSAFILVNNQVDDFDFGSVIWKIQLDNFEASLLQLKEIIAHSVWPQNWCHAVKALWLEIAILECLEYLEFLAAEREFSIEITDDLQNNFLTCYAVTRCLSVLPYCAKLFAKRLTTSSET